MMRTRLGRFVRARSHRGQMLIIVAAAMVALIGILGLAIDLGYTFAQKRTVQNAADAGALAGAQELTTWSSTNNISVVSTVDAIVAMNALGPITPSVVSCQYVDDNLQPVGDCSTTVPSTASGVQVSASETHNTFFMRAIPGAPQTATTSATSTARVYKVQNAPGDAPFIVCGGATGAAAAPSPNAPVYALGSGAFAAGQSSAGSIMALTAFHQGPSQGSSTTGDPGGATGGVWNASASAYPQAIGPDLAKQSTPTPTPDPGATSTPTATPTSSSTSLLLTGTSTINPDAVGLTFELHGSQVDTCGAGEAFKGLADNSGTNDGATIPGWWQATNGVHAGPTRFTVSGLNGCQGNGDLNSCVLLIPVADSGSGNGSHIEMHVVAVAAFVVHAGGGGIEPGCTAANCHVGTLLGQYTIGAGTKWPPDPTTGWLPGANGLFMERLVPSGTGRP